MVDIEQKPFGFDEDFAAESALRMNVMSALDGGATSTLVRVDYLKWAMERITEAATTIERYREALEAIAAKNDLSGISDDEVESAARGALYDCECIARQALSHAPEGQPGDGK